MFRFFKKVLVFFYCKIRSFVRKLEDFLIYPFFKRKLIKMIKPNKDALCIFVYQGIGDICYGLSFLEALKKSYPTKKIVIYGFDNRAKSVFDFFRSYYDKLIVSEYDGFYKFMRFWLRNYNKVMNSLDKSWCIYYISVELFTRNIGNLSLLDASLSFTQLIKEVIFKLPEGSKITAPSIPMINKNELIEKFDIPKKSIIISPYSESLCNKPIKAYEELAEHYSNKGYKVFCNLSPSQQLIKNATPLNCTIEELYNIAPICKYFISKRSGIIDFLISTSTTIVANFHNDAIKNIFSIQGWGINENAYDFNGKDEEFLPFVQSIIGE